jgi:hypothetical protein
MVILFLFRDTRRSQNIMHVYNELSSLRAKAKQTRKDCIKRLDCRGRKRPRNDNPLKIKCFLSKNEGSLQILYAPIKKNPYLGGHPT